MHAIETVRSIATPLAAITALGILPIVSIMAILIKDASIEPLTTVSEPWTLVTASFVEKNVLVMILHAALGIGAQKHTYIHTDASMNGCARWVGGKSRE